ncbi:MAG: hypothetical protein H7Y11_10350 [Armatimonadetes bacterium]|nr:hypothetical protein [Anaerolineae bacterium]
MKKWLAGSITLVLALLLMGMPLAAHQAGDTQEGWLSVIHWTPRPGSGDLAENIYTLNLDDGHKIHLDIAPELLAAAGGVQSLKGTRVRVTLAENQSQTLLTPGSRAKVLGLQPAVIPLVVPEGIGRAVTGSQVWTTLMCSFTDTNPVGGDTDTLDYFQTMYGNNEYPGMDHYWRQQSYNQVNLIGSTAYGWFELPQSQTYYMPTPGSGQNIPGLFLLLDDCIAAADATVDFTQYIGINMMFDGILDCCAWGGTSVVTVDGQTKLWRLTWNPPWSWRDITVVAHEVGHGFGLPHANNYDGDGNPYDNPWDVMSDTYEFCGTADHPEYGCLGQHTSAYHKDVLGWFATQARVLAVGNTAPITLDHSALQTVDDYRTIIVPINGSNTFYYTIEARQTSNANYDIKLPGKAVIIHEVETSREEPAWLVGGTNDSNSSTVTNGPDGAWLVGETFTGNGISITVVSQNADGFTVSVNNDDNGVVAPNQLTAAAAGETQINLAWDDNAGDEEGFTVESSLNGSSWSVLGTTTSASYNATGIACGTLHYFRVKAYRASTQSTYSNVASATTDTCTVPSTATSTPTATPTATLTATLTPTATATTDPLITPSATPTTDPLITPSATATASATTDPLVTPTATYTPTATSTPLPGVELLSNIGFDELDAESKPITTPWTLGATNTGDKIKCSKEGKPVPTVSGICAFRFKGSEGEAGSISQVANTAARAVVEAGDVLTLSFHVNAETVPTAKAKLRVKYTDTAVEKGKITVDIVAVTTGYAFVTAEPYTVLSSSIASVKVKFNNSSTSGKFYIDDVSLRLIEGVAPTATATDGTPAATFTPEITATATALPRLGGQG